MRTTDRKRDFQEFDEPWGPAQEEGRQSPAGSSPTSLTPFFIPRVRTALHDFLGFYDLTP